MVGLSRFLIRPSVRCRHLASHVLGMVLQRLGIDFERQYGYRPWVLETFVAPDQDGTCFKAANFLYIGSTLGRGRRAKTNACTKTLKSIYVYELDRRWRRRLGVAYVDLTPTRSPAEGLDADSWAMNEFGGAPLGDTRWSKRLVRNAQLVASGFGEAVTGLETDDPAALPGYYRFIRRQEDSEITCENMLRPRRALAIERMRGKSTVLCIQDGAKFNYAARPRCEERQVIGRNQITTSMYMHTTMAVTAQGVPLGMLRCGFDAQAKKMEHAAQTQRWMDGCKDIDEAASEVSTKTRIITVINVNSKVHRRQLRFG